MFLSSKFLKNITDRYERLTDRMAVKSFLYLNFQL